MAFLDKFRRRKIEYSKIEYEIGKNRKRKQLNRGGILYEKEIIN